LTSEQIRKAPGRPVELPLCACALNAYIPAVKWLTRQEQFVLTVGLALLLVGLAVKTYRAAHPPVLDGRGVEATATNAPVSAE